MSYAHRSGVIHRDLKPANILVAVGGAPKLVDFGIAKLLQPGEGDRDGSSTRTRCFTPEYASPEQVRGEPVSVSTDVYSLGLVLFQLLLDRRPFELMDCLRVKPAASCVSGRRIRPRFRSGWRGS